MNYYSRSLALIKNGCPLVKLVTLPVCDEIVRIKYSVPNTKLELISQITEHFNTQFAELESVYTKAGAL
jgi:V/A-type H+-transporting ATPase subunit A